MIFVDRDGKTDFDGDISLIWTKVTYRINN